MIPKHLAESGYIFVLLLGKLPKTNIKDCDIVVNEFEL